MELAVIDWGRAILTQVHTAPGRNYGSREFEGHMHNGLWRVDVNLGGPDNNSALVMEHTEPHEMDKAKARTQEVHDELLLGLMEGKKK